MCTGSSLCQQKVREVTVKQHLQSAAIVCDAMCIVPLVLAT
jgi:hypothetical protein